MAETYIIPIVLLFPLLLFFIKLLNIFKTPLPPGPKPWPIIGNLLQIGKNPHVTLAKFAQSYGPLFSVRLGAQVVVVGSSPQAAEQIFRTNDRVLSGRQVPEAVPAKKPELNHLSLGWAFDCNDKWKLLRTICKSELFSVRSLDSQSLVREEKVSEMVKHLSLMEGKEIELRKVVFALVFNMVSNIFVSKDFIGYDKDEELKVVVTRFLETISSPNLCDYFPICKGFDIQGLNKKTMMLMRVIYAMWEPTIKERRERRISNDVASQRDFLDVLLDNGFSDDQINYLFLDLIAAATDTSVSTIEWTMAELMKNPKFMIRARDELAREIKNDFLRESDLNRLPYLQACVKETLRLHPAGPLLLPHRALESCKIMNYTIPKNAQILVNVWAIGRDPKVWEEPLVYNPDRFLNCGTDFKGKDFEYIPFGAGRRICPGLGMAAKHVPLIVGSLIHLFEWSLPLGNDPKEMDMSEKFIIAMRKEQPLVLIPALIKK